MTQGRTQKEAYEMVADMLETVVNKAGFNANAFKGPKGTFEIGATEPKHLISLLLRRKRESSGLSLAQVAQCLGMSPRNAYQIMKTSGFYRLLSLH